jgi:hypothetical protein
MGGHGGGYVQPGHGGGMQMGHGGGMQMGHGGGHRRKKHHWSWGY